MLLKYLLSGTTKQVAVQAEIFFLFPFRLRIITPIKTKTVPTICSTEIFSFKIKLDKKMVAIGPTLAMIAIFEDPISAMPFVIKKDGKTVLITATPIPIRYT